MADDIVERLLRATGECPCRRPTIGSQIISCCARCDAEYAAAVVLEARDAEIEGLRAAIDAVLLAVADAGSHPEYHDEVRRRHEREWPTLWRSIAGLKEARHD